jgi:hypothetical protein
MSDAFRRSVAFATSAQRIRPGGAMRSSLRAILVAVSLLLPHGANAGPVFTMDLRVRIEEPGIAFGPAGAELSTEFGFDGIFIDGIEVETPDGFFSGDVTFVTGALQSLTVDDSDPDRVTSRYEFGPGLFTLTADWGGNQGEYNAPLLSLVIEIRCEQELSVLDCGDASGEHGSLGDAFASVGPGEFDAILAAALHVHKIGGAFDFDVALDGITGAPTDNFRISGSAGGSEDIVIPVAVPEPSILSLLLLAPVLSRRFRR